MARSQMRALLICNWWANIDRLFCVVAQQRATARISSMYNKKTLVAVSVGTFVGVVGIASAALANDFDESANAQVARVNAPKK
jgi:hypothetical protein